MCARRHYLLSVFLYTLVWVNRDIPNFTNNNCITSFGWCVVHRETQCKQTMHWPSRRGQTIMYVASRRWTYLLIGTLLILECICVAGLPTYNTLLRNKPVYYLDYLVNLSSTLSADAISKFIFFFRFVLMWMRGPLAYLRTWAATPKITHTLQINQPQCALVHGDPFGMFIFWLLHNIKWPNADR